MLIELRDTNPVVYEVIDKVIQGACKQLQSVSPHFDRYPTSISKTLTNSPIERDSDATRRRATRHLVAHLYAILGTPLDETGPPDHLPLGTAPSPVKLPTAYPETEHHRPRLPRPHGHTRRLQGAL